MNKIPRASFLLALPVALVLSVATPAAAQVVQVGHAAPFADSIDDTAVTVLVNGNVIVPEFRYGETATLNAGGAPQIDVDIVPVGAGDPVISETVMLGENVTVLAVGDGVRQPLGLLRLADDMEAPDGDTVNVRVVHAAPFAEAIEDTEVAVRTAAGAEIAEPLNSVSYLDASGFLGLPAGEADLKVTSTDGMTNLIDPAPVELPGGANVTIVAIGNGDQQPLGALAFPNIGQLETRIPVDNSVTGWWQSLVSGREGFILQPIPAENRIVGTIYSWNPDGSGNTLWLTFDGSFADRQATAEVQSFSGGELLGENNIDSVVFGTVAFEFVDCQTAVATLELDDGTELTWDLGRLTQTLPCTLD